MLQSHEKLASYWRLVATLLLIILGFITIIGTGGSGNGEESSAKFEGNEPFSFDVTVSNHDRFSLLAVNGEITITASSGIDTVTVAGIKRVQSKSSIQDAKAHLQDLQVVWNSLANNVSVQTIQPKDTVDRNYRIDYSITLPSYFIIQVDSTNGIVTLDSIENDIAVNIANGEVTLMNIHGSARIKLANGTIDMSSAIGDIHLAIPTSTSAVFSATVLFGAINVSNLVLQDETKTTSSLGGTLGSGQGMILLKTSGNINVLGF